MATFDANVTRHATGDARLAAAVHTLSERFGLDPADDLKPPRVADAEFRAILATEALADTLERLVAAVPDQSPELIEALDATDERVRVALVALSEHAGLSDMAGVTYSTDASLVERREALADAVARNLEAIVAVIAPAPDPVPDLTAMTRDELDAMAAGLGIDAPDKLPNKAAVIDAITAVKEAS